MADRATEALVAGIPDHLLREVEREFRTGWNLQKVRTIHQQKWEAKRRKVPARAIEGLGQLEREIPVTSYHFWGKKLGYQCWSDKNFLKEWDRDNPEYRVAYQPSKQKVMVNGTKGLFGPDGKILK